MTYPADSHVHTEWSWDTRAGSMDRTCARAVELGLPAVAFTEHLDHTVWTVSPVNLARLGPDDPFARYGDESGQVHPPAFDAAGYLAAVDRCRDRYPDLRILSGLELGEPHWHAAAVEQVLAAGPFDRVLGSLHGLPSGSAFQEPPDLYQHRDQSEVLRAYLLEIAEMVEHSGVFAVLAHIDYPLRTRPYDVLRLEDEFRHALRATARSGRALEINTSLPLDPRILRWWWEEGGPAVTFGSDAHTPADLARGFPAAAALAEAIGFRPGDPWQPWGR